MAHTGYTLSYGPIPSYREQWRDWRQYRREYSKQRSSELASDVAARKIAGYLVQALNGNISDEILADNIIDLLGE